MVTPEPNQDQLPPLEKPFENLRLFYDYTKWHVQLYAGGTIATLVLGKLQDNLLLLFPVVLFILAAGCAGTLLGNVSRFNDEAALNEHQMEIFVCGKFLRGRKVRSLEKWFFWTGAIALVCLMFSGLGSKASGSKSQEPCCCAATRP